MATAHDVAKYILREQGSMSTWKLQKLLYYAQAWHLVWDDEPLFNERIDAWANGPVVREVYNQHRGQFTVRSWPRGNIRNLTQSERETIDIVLRGYGKLSGRQLSHLTHSEAPWQEAREGLEPTERSATPISPVAMAEYYGALDASEDAEPVENLDWDDDLF